MCNSLVNWHLQEAFWRITSSLKCHEGAIRFEKGHFQRKKLNSSATGFAFPGF